MPSNVRVILALSTGTYGGAGVWQQLAGRLGTSQVKVVMNKPIPKWQKEVELFKLVFPLKSGEAMLWVWREPKHAAEAESKYQKTLRYYGFPPNRGLNRFLTARAARPRAPRQTPPITAREPFGQPAFTRPLRELLAEQLNPNPFTMQGVLGGVNGATATVNEPVRGVEFQAPDPDWGGPDEPF